MKNYIHDIHDKELDSVDVIKYFGVHVDYNLCWKDHSKSLTSMLSRGIGMLKAKYYLPKASLETLYSGIVDSHFRYCCSVWRSLLETGMKLKGVWGCVTLSPTENLPFRRAGTSLHRET